MMITPKHGIIVERLESLEDTIDRLDERVRCLLGAESEEQCEYIDKSDSSLISFLDTTPEFVIELEEKVSSITNNLQRLLFIDEECKKEEC